MTKICLPLKHVNYRFFLDTIHYEASYDMPVVASDCSASMPGNTVIPLGPLSTLVTLSTMILKYFEKIYRQF